MGEKIYLQRVTSTSNYLRERKDLLGDFSFVSADYQSQGHGRNGRSWLSEEGSNLTFSFLIKDKEIISYGPKITLVVASLVAQAIEGLGIKKVAIKWPNDIYIDGRKAVGILLEGSLPEYLIVGVGVNVNQTSFPGEYRHPPTSLALCLGRQIDLSSFRASLFASLEKGLHHLSESFPASLSYFASHDYLLGKHVSLDGEGDYVAKGIDEQFRLLLEGDGKNIANSSGEIQIHG